LLIFWAKHPWRDEGKDNINLVLKITKLGCKAQFPVSVIVSFWVLRNVVYLIYSDVSDEPAFIILKEAVLDSGIYWRGWKEENISFVKEVCRSFCQSTTCSSEQSKISAYNTNPKDDNNLTKTAVKRTKTYRLKSCRLSWNGWLCCASKENETADYKKDNRFLD
jgi:hypothetical protein